MQISLKTRRASLSTRNDEDFPGTRKADGVGWKKGDHSPKYTQEDYAGRGSGACLQVGAWPGGDREESTSNETALPSWSLTPTLLIHSHAAQS